MDQRFPVLWRRGRRDTLLHPTILLAVVVAVLVLPTAMTRAASTDPPAVGTAPLAQATPADALPVETQLQPEDQSGIFLNILNCSARFGGDHQALLENCTAASDVNFEIFGPNLTLSSTGGIALERLPAGQYRIREFIPSGYGGPTAFCVIGPTYQAPTGFAPVVVYDGYYEFALGQGQALFCNWFNISNQAPAESATIYVNKHFCPSAAQFDAYQASVYDLAATCHEPPLPVPFSVHQNGVRIAGGVSGGAPNLVVFNGLPVGDVVVIEEMPEGYGQPRVFCSVKDELGASRAPLTEAPTDNDRIFWRLNAGDVVFCDWFNVPEPRGTTISLVKLLCPDHVDYHLDSYDEYASACTAPGAGVSFKLDGARTGNPGEQLTDAAGQITWSEMEADDYYLTEQVPNGYGRPVVFCAYYDPAAFAIRIYQPYPVSHENRIEFDVADGQAISCIWFNISSAWDHTAPAASPSSAPLTDDPAPSPDEESPAAGDPIASPDASQATSQQATTSGPASDEGPSAASTATDSATAALTIRAHRCDAGYDVLAGDADPAADCPDQRDGVAFELVTIGGPADQDRRRADLGGDPGATTFSRLAAGDYRLAPVNFVAGSTAFIFSCESDQRDFSAFPVVPFATGAADGSIRLTLVAGESLACDWYAVPAPGAGQG